MIRGIGADLCQISRMAGLLGDAAFLKRYFHADEQAYILSRGVYAAASMAGVFAAKEAFAKAAGSGFFGIAPQDIIIRHTAEGAPYYEAVGTAAAALARVRAAGAHLSISHEGGLALAFAVLEGEDSCSTS